MRILLSCIFFTTLTFASLVNSAFIYNDLKILEDLDIDSSFITDPKLQKKYEQILKNRKNTYTNHLNEAYLFVPKIKQILKDNNIPPAFLYLVMAESNFNLTALSYKKATGLWQFMPYTAKAYGLEKNAYIDERLDIVKSTHAAVKYLKALKKRFGKWYLAAIAYNCGEGRVYEALTRASLDMYLKDNKHNSETKEFRKIIRLYQRKQLHFRSLYKVYTKVKEYGYNPGIQELLYFQKGLRRQYLPGESQDYIRKIIALGLMNNREFVVGDHEHLLNRGVSDPIATVHVKGGLLLSDVAKVIGVSFDELHLINKQIKQGIISPHKDMEQIYIPYSRLSRFQTNIDNLKDSVYAMHKVKSGDSLYKIGKKYGIDYKLIKKFNKLKSNILSLNQHLIIPADPKLLPKQDEVYVIKKGDSLSLIAKKFNVDLKKLMKDNKITTSNIIVGDKLVISYE